MFSIIQLINATFGSQEFLFFVQFISFTCKIYLLIAVIFHGLRTATPKKMLLLLMGILIGSMFHADASWMALHIHQIIFPSLDFKIVGFMGRIGWAFFLIQNQSLSLFLETIIEKKFRLRKQHLFFLSLSVFLICYELYFAFFRFSVPSTTGNDLELEKRIIQIACLLLFISFVPVLYKALHKIRTGVLPKILANQLKIFITFLILPHFILDLITNKLVFQSLPSFIAPLNKYVMLSISTMLITYAIYYCCKRMIGLRFLNFNNHVKDTNNFNFINDFKDILEQLSHVTAMKELAHITQSFFNAAFSLPIGRTRLYVRKTFTYAQEDPYYDIALISNKVEDFIANHDEPSCPIATLLRQSKIFIKDELEFTNFYDEQHYLLKILAFLDSINADIFLPIYERQTITAYIIVECNTRGNRLYNNVERDEMLVFTSYLSNIINILKYSNLEALLRKEKELQEELYHKHQEINQYKESLKSFLRANKDRKIGIILYKNRKFTFSNQTAQEIIGIDINTQEGHPLSQSLKQLARTVQQYKTAQIITTKDSAGIKLVLSGISSLETNTVIITVYYPEISDIIKTQLEQLKDPSKWDYLLYLETTQSGQLINQLIPGNGEILLNFKIDLLSIALSRKAILLEMAEDDLLSTVEIIHSISLRQTLHTLKLTVPEKNDEVAFKLFGINPLLDKGDSEVLLQKLDSIGTLFIQNIHFLSLETQNYLAEFIMHGYYHRLRSDYKCFSNVRIICSTTKNLPTLVAEGLFSKALFNELKKTSLSMPSLAVLPKSEISELAQGFSEQALKTQTLKNFLELNTKDTDKLLDQCPMSLQELKTKVHQILVHKSTKHKIYDKTEFDPAYHVSDPEVAKAIRRGKKTLENPQLMGMLWDKFKNQNKIAMLLGVNRSSVYRRCQKYNLIDKANE